MNVTHIPVSFIERQEKIKESREGTVVKSYDRDARLAYTADLNQTLGLYEDLIYSNIIRKRLRELHYLGNRFR